MSNDQITARIGATNIEFRRQTTFRRQITKTEFDTEVYNFYRQHHPIDADTPVPVTQRKDNT